MELARKEHGTLGSPFLQEPGATPGGVADPGAEHPPLTPLRGPDPESTTTMLRRCTALATRARVDLLSAGRGNAAGELATLLRGMRQWDPASLGAPDPIMVVLAAAALQDLVERLRAADQPLPEDSLALATGADAALEVLRELMAEGRIDVPA